MEELLVQIDTSKHVIDTNFDKIKVELEKTLENYKGIIVDENTIKQSKADLADLRKMSKEIDTVRKQIKGEWLKPYQDFEEKCKELTSLIDAPITEIKEQLDAFEVKRVAEKKKHLMELYEANIGEYSEFLPYSAIENPKWTNATCSDKDIVFDISEKVTKVKSDLEAIKALHSEIEDECIRIYKASGNMLSAAIVKNSDYLQAKAAAEKKIREEVKEEVREELKEEPKRILVDTETGEIISDFTFRVSGNENIQKVKDFLDFSEIPYVEV